MKKYYIKDLSKGMTLNGETFAVQEVKKAETKNGKPYYRVKLIDKSGDINAQIWSEAISNVDQGGLKVGKVIMIDASVEDYRGTLQLNISKATSVSESDLDEYLESSDFDLDDLWKTLENYIAKVENVNIKKFLEAIFYDKFIKDNYKTHPAAEYVHHSFHGGLLEHVVEMLDLTVPISKYYKEADFDLVTAGIILHDIGKLYELQIEGTVVQRTKEGYLVGHLVKSYELLLKFGEKILDEEQLINLKHIVLSHHGILEYGSPVVPATIEAAIVHAVDEASTSIRIFQKVIRKNSNKKESFSDWDPILKTRVYNKK